MFGTHDIKISDNWDEHTCCQFPKSYGKNENAERNEIAPYRFKPAEVEVFYVQRE